MTSNSTASGHLDTNGRDLPSAAELEALSSFLRADVSESENADVDLAEFLKRLGRRRRCRRANRRALGRPVGTT